MSPIIKRVGPGQYVDATQEYERLQAEIDVQETRRLMPLDKILFPITGAFLGFMSGNPATFLADLISLQLFHESILSHPIGLICTALIYISTTGLGAIAGNEFRRFFHSGIKPQK